MAALSALDEEHQALPLAAWHLDREAEDECDLHASDGVHVHFSALRGLIIGLVQGVAFTDSPVVTREVKDGAHDAALGLIGRIRAELQDRPDSRVFVTYRLDRPSVTT